jgi:predicted enzyme related to lactoylglutathione lyase
MTQARLHVHAVVAAATALLATLATAAEAAERYWPPIVDPPTGQYTPGRFVWGDLVTHDVGRAAEFYGKVFGWTFETYGGKDDRDTYTLALADGLPIGGLVFDPRAVDGKTPSARWVGLISVPDVRAAADAAARSGGKIVFAPTMLGERGETAVLRDPDGALFGVVRSRNGDPADYAGDLNEWLWLDLWTGDVERAARFYSTVVGYETLAVEQDGPRNGVHLVSGGRVRAGIMRKQNERDTVVWLPYLRVADAKATAANAKAAGGKVLFEPTRLPRAIVAIVADPTGAPVGVAQLLNVETQP